MKYIILFCLFCIGCIHAAELKIEALKAPFHVGESVMACGILAQVTERPKQTYLSMDKAYPNQSLTLLIWADDYPQFVQRFGGMKKHIKKRVCARGLIEEYKNTLQINVVNPQFLRIMD